MTGMLMGLKVSTNLSTLEVIMERIFDAPRETVFKAYSQTEQLERWWGPKGWQTSTLKMDFRPGGFWHFCMRSPDGQMNPCAKFAYKEITPVEQIVYSETFVDEQGTSVDSLPERQVTVTFLDVEGKTKLIMRTKFASRESLQAVVDMGMVQGFSENFARLDEYLQVLPGPGVNETGYTITRILDAPPGSGV